ncbi:MAG: universal stress protein [Haloferacaceae archaeon]
MRTLVVGVDSVHASARVADYLQDRLDGGTVHAAAPRPPDAGREAVRDAEDALNGVRSRLGVVADVETHRVDGDFAAGLLSLADDVGADELVVGREGGADGGEANDAGWVARVVDGATRPVVVVPVE